MSIFLAQFVRKSQCWYFHGERDKILHSILLPLTLPFENGCRIHLLRKEGVCNHWRWRVGASVTHGCPSSTHSFYYASVSENRPPHSQRILLSFCDTNWRALSFHITVAKQVLTDNDKLPLNLFSVTLSSICLPSLDVCPPPTPAIPILKPSGVPMALPWTFSN